MLYRLNLYRDEKLISTELLEGASIADSKAQAISAVTSGGADQAHLRNPKGDIVFYHPRKLERHRAQLDSN